MSLVKFKYDNFKQTNFEAKKQGLKKEDKMQHKNIKLFAVTLFCIGLSGLQAQTVKDIDGNIYKTVTIGTQVWMADDKAWKTLTTPAYCWYKNDATANKNKYGALYNWYAVNTNKLCPRGWHVPTDIEWRTLTNYLGGESVAGGKLKETGTTHWESPNTGATNESGFKALPSGYRNYAGGFDDSGSNVEIFRSNGCWWSSTELYTFNAYYRRLYNSLSDVYSSLSVKQCGYSVRCLRD
jgi:uncharacterized protein (TIGR02145 family)